MFCIFICKFWQLYAEREKERGQDSLVPTNDVKPDITVKSIRTNALNRHKMPTSTLIYTLQ